MVFLSYPFRSDPFSLCAEADAEENKENQMEERERKLDKMPGYNVLFAFIFSKGTNGRKEERNT